MHTEDRVQAHTADHVNHAIEEEARRRVMRNAGASEGTISRRISELDEEWDVERYLEMNASALAFTGTVLGLFVNRKFLAIPFVVLPFLFNHAVRGWCPPVPFLRRRGVRTRREIDAEKYALKALRGDFKIIGPPAIGTQADRGQRAWQAANA